MKKYMILAFILVALAPVYAFAPAANWQIADKCTIRFSAGGEVGGIFRTMKGAIVFDEQNLAASTFDLSVDVASVNTGNALMNTHIKSAEWFDAGKYPVIRFVSKKIVKAGTGLQVTGDMEMHGIKKETTLPFSFQNKGGTAIFSSAFTVNRSDFHIGKPGGDVEEKVKMDISVPVVKK